MISSQNIDQLQIEAYRQMTGEERLRIGIGLSAPKLSHSLPSSAGLFNSSVGIDAA